MAGQFDFQSSTSPLLAALTQVPEQRLKMQQQQEEIRQNRLNSLLSGMQSAATIARSAQQIQQGNLETQQTQSKMQGLQNAQDILKEPSMGAPVSSFQFGPQNQTPTFGQTDQGPTQTSRLNAAILQANPQVATTALSGQLEPKSFDQLLADRVSKGMLTVQDAAALKTQMNPNLISIQTDPTTGLPFRTNKLGGPATPVQLPGQAAPAGSPGVPSGKGSPSTPATPQADLPPVAKKDILDAKKGYLDDENVKTAAKVLNISDRLRSLVIANNPASLTNLKVQIAELAGIPGGRVTSSETFAEAGSRAFGAQNKRLFERLWDGKLTKSDQADFLSMLDQTDQSNSKLLNDSLDSHTAAFNALYPTIPSSRTRQIIGLPLANQLKKYKATPAARANGSQAATHRWNPQTGQVEPIQ